MLTHYHLAFHFRSIMNSLLLFNSLHARKMESLMADTQKNMVESKLEIAFKAGLPSFEGKLIRLLSGVTMKLFSRSPTVCRLRFGMVTGNRVKNRKLFGNQRIVNGIDGTCFLVG